VQWRHPFGGRLHVGGEAGIFTHTPEPAIHSHYVTYGCHRVHIAVNSKPKECLCKGEMSSPHGLTYPRPVWLQACAKQLMQFLLVALTKCGGHLRRGPLWNLRARAILSPSASVYASPANESEPIVTPRRRIECRRR
jgi:hypothetical protein